MLDDMVPIGLDDLLAVAELQTRIDRKYLVDHDGLRTVLGSLRGELAVLEIAGARRFVYESVYFDTPQLRSFLGAARSRRRRFKVRTRSYLDSGQCMLELKTRADTATVKIRVPYPLPDRHRLTGEGVKWIESVARVPIDAADLGPALVTRYNRATLLHMPTGTRLTCDSDLCFEDFGGRTGSLAPSIAVVEVKSEGGSGPIDRRLWRAGYRPCPVSKYGTGMALLHPYLPANKWNRTLRRYFGWRPEQPRTRAPRRLQPVAAGLRT